MARPVTTDKFANFRFHVRVVDGIDFLNEGLPVGKNLRKNTIIAGFQSATIPTVSLDEVLYKTGLNVFPQKQTGSATVADFTLMRGASVDDNAFYRWFMRCAAGAADYIDIAIEEYRSAGQQDGVYVANIDVSNVPPGSRRVRCNNCSCVDLRLAGDKESQASEVSMLELTLRCEEVVIEIYENDEWTAVDVNA